MLLIIQDHRLLDYGQLMTVYEESNRQKGAEICPFGDAAEQLLLAEQSFYSYVCDILRDKHTVCAIWAPGGKYQTVLRLEPYSDGLLVTALETAPAARQKGYATLLLQSVKERFCGVRLYSHIDLNNVASICVHEKCGFRRILDHARFLDGSVSVRSYTYLYES